jgi:hypothetical protein
MAGRLICLLGAALIAATVALPARAGGVWGPADVCEPCTRDAIYALFNRIAFLEARPDIDDAVKGPEITAARAEIRRLRAMLGPPRWDWPTPCCYSRKPLVLR